jgi:hypothetical protein
MLMALRFTHRGVTATPEFLDIQTDQTGAIPILSNWVLTQDGETLKSPTTLKSEREVTEWIDQYLGE